MGLSEILVAGGTAGLAAIILAVVKLFQFLREANKSKVDDIISRVSDDNERWHSRYGETQENLDSVRKELSQVQILNQRYKIELMSNGISEERIKELEEGIK